MNYSLLAEAVRDVVAEWRQSLDFDAAVLAIEDPGTYTAQISPLVEARLTHLGINVDDLRADVSRETFIHLPNVFDASSLAETPKTFLPVPSCEGVLMGKAAALAAISAIGQQAVSYGSENNGELFVNLVVIPGDGTFAEKSRDKMRGHTDGASFPPRGYEDAVRSKIAPSPDFVCLIGLRNPDQVATTVMPLSAIVDRLSDEHIAELKQPKFQIHTQQTFVIGTKRALGEVHIADQVSVLYDIDDQLGIRFSHKRVATEGAKGEAALTAFKEVCPLCEQAAVINPGDLLLVSNRFALHGRREVGIKVGGETRWLLRTYGLAKGAARLDQFHSGSNFKLFP